MNSGYVPHPYIKEFYYIYVTNQQMHIDKIFIIYYYLPTCFGRFCDHHQDVIQEYEQYTKGA